MKKILVVIGTRPEAIKLAPVIMGLKAHTSEMKVRVCLTAQHREMVDPLLTLFGIKPDYDFNLMEPGQDLSTLTARVLTGMKTVLEEWQPNQVVVQGDTTTAMAAALAAFYQGIPVAHVEAGLRTFSIRNPFPEEMNRQVISRLASIHFAPTEAARDNLLREGFAPGMIWVTGNTVVDALLGVLNRLDCLEDPEIVSIRKLIKDKDYLLVTCHRRENFGEGIRQIMAALIELTQNTEISIIYPVHPNPSVHRPVYQELSNRPGINLIPPVSYPAFIYLMKNSRFILTDSGGIQEEAPSLGKPVLLLRGLTERTEAVDTGWVKMVPVETKKMVNACRKWINQPPPVSELKTGNPFGDGFAADRIVTILADE